VKAVDSLKLLSMPSENVETIQESLKFILQTHKDNLTNPKQFKIVKKLGEGS